MNELEIARVGAAQQERQSILDALTDLGARCGANFHGIEGEQHVLAIENCLTTIRNLPLSQRGGARG